MIFGIFWYILVISSNISNISHMFQMDYSFGASLKPTMSRSSARTCVNWGGSAARSSDNITKILNGGLFYEEYHRICQSQLRALATYKIALKSKCLSMYLLMRPYQRCRSPLSKPCRHPEFPHPAPVDRQAPSGITAGSWANCWRNCLMDAMNQVTIEIQWSCMLYILKCICIYIYYNDNNTR